MEVLSKVLLVGFGGAVGANLRYWIGGWIANWMQDKFQSALPWHTFFINVTGSFVIGFFMGLSLQLNWNPGWRLFVAIGILGGYTTFSSFAYEAIGLLTSRDYVKALLYIEGSAFCTVLGAWLGLVLSRLVLGGRV